MRAEGQFHPYVLSSHVKGDFVKTIIEVKEALNGAGFQLAGEYSPYDDAHVIVVTDELLTDVASAGDIGSLFAQAIRVSVTRVGEAIQVSYANPEYYEHAYQLKKSLAPVKEKLVSVMGQQETFGPEGMSPEKLRGYHYSYGMEYFDNFMELAKYKDYRSALNEVEQGLEEKRGGVSIVYRIDLPKKRASLFGVAMSEGFSSDRKIMETLTLDVGELRHTARLPYEVLVVGGRILALHPRFRIAVDFPGMKMVGEHSFMQLSDTPSAIEEALTRVAGGSVTQ
ncbi:hypothetical protein [Solemya velesiana gill symbiont]|uniref:Uncharacterized protein n=1 Tax=Solemya velesiana gill symbiont TaxID=1918948 RepID=A0A1T2KWM3_9GAMM|nr:hypothetical protein [Solemya velesiana gill symbiont]OOZ37222.1 hypothetical protein BOW51_03280 [Solemya velesiana gill symbiont]